MRKHFAASALAFVFLGALIASCNHSRDDVGECQTDLGCGEGDACSALRCVNHQCVKENAPAGALADSSFTPPPCHRFVCDGQGGEVLEVDISAKPTGSASDCHRLDCDANGNTITVVDTTVTPYNSPGDCHAPTCDADGNVMTVVDVNDPLTDNPGDCMKYICDADGNAMEVPADDPPTDVCQTFTCQNGQAVGMPANVGMSCSPHGVICSAGGKCDACPQPDASCTDNGPGAGSHSLAQAYDLGDIGYCDSNGYPLCGTLKAGETSYFRYISDGSGSFCEFDPYVRVQASGTVTLCEYFDCPSVTCPAGATKATLAGSGNPGCCEDGSAPAMAIEPSCVDSDAHITVESKSPSCVSYLLDFHT